MRLQQYITHAYRPLRLNDTRPCPLEIQEARSPHERPTVQRTGPERGWPISARLQQRDTEGAHQGRDRRVCRTLLQRGRDQLDISVRVIATASPHLIPLISDSVSLTL